MPTPYLALGCAVIVPTGGIALAWSGVLIDSLSATQAISGTATLTADTYSPDGFINHAASKMRTSIYDAMVALGWVTTKPANAAAIPFKIGTSATITPDNLNPLRIVMTSTGGALHSGNATTWQSFSLVNTSTAAPWCWLGLAYPGETRSLTIVGAGPDTTGRCQPRWLFFLRASFQDTGDLITYSNQYSYNLGAGQVVQFGIGEPHLNRTLRLVTQTQALIGPPWHIARFSAFGATRELLSYLTLDETLFTGISGTDVNTSYLTSPVYLRAGRWWARYRDTTGGALRMFDVWPSAQSPASGRTIQAYSEGYALVEEWRRTGLLFRYDPIDSTGSTAWTWQAYAPRAAGEWQVQCDRIGNGLFYTLELPAKLVEDPQLAVP